jgi:predicted HAD superfamily phosphohydrolase
MKKTSVSIIYEDEKLNAVKMYMEQRDLDFKEELEKSVDSLYAKYVPANVREFIDMKSTISKQTKKKSIDALSNQSAEVEL